MTDRLSERDAQALAGDYELLREIGRGASAVVYEARDLALGRHVAVKVVHPRIAATASDDMERLAREARTVARLHHPNIVTLYAVKRLPDTGGLALVMQLVPGGTLKDEIAREGALSPERAEQVLRDIAAGLAYANARGVVHRDVKPENIFLDDSGSAMLADFGIAWSADQESRLTMTGAAIGTPTYMAPEQIDGGAPDARSDLYSLGLVTWEMLAGQRPWAGESLFNVMLKQKTAELPPLDLLRPGVVPDRLQYIVERMLQKHPGARWAGAEALVGKLDRWVVPADYPQWQASRRRRREQAQAQVAAAPAPTSAPADVATVVFRRAASEGVGPSAARPIDSGMAVATQASTSAVAHPADALVPHVIAVPEGAREVATPVIEERPPSWVLDAEPVEPPSRRWLVAGLVGTLVVVGLVVGLVPSARSTALAWVAGASSGSGVGVATEPGQAVGASDGPARPNLMPSGLEATSADSASEGVVRRAADTMLDRGSGTPSPASVYAKGASPFESPRQVNTPVAAVRPAPSPVRTSRPAEPVRVLGPAAPPPEVSVPRLVVPSATVRPGTVPVLLRSARPAPSP
jgi:tRNA A-37 threonylcarbamoyl transferase component Bud32